MTNHEAALPTREGPRPLTNKNMPHSQIGVRPMPSPGKKARSNMTLAAAAHVQLGAEGPEGGRPERAGSPQCATNISPAEQRKRLIAGLIGVGLGLALLVVLLVVGADRLWRLALLPMYWGGMISVFQWRDKT